MLKGRLLLKAKNQVVMLAANWALDYTHPMQADEAVSHIQGVYIFLKFKLLEEEVLNVIQEMDK